MQVYEGTIVDYTQYHWSSDWNGDEVGYPEIDVVGLYSTPDGNTNFYVDVETRYVLETWPNED